MLQSKYPTWFKCKLNHVYINYDNYYLPHWYSKKPMTIICGSPQIINPWLGLFRIQLKPTKTVDTEPIWPLWRHTVGVWRGSWRWFGQTENCQCGERWLFCTPTRKLIALVYTHTHTHTHYNLTYISVYSFMFQQREENLD